jgi:hypothetical protein
MYTPHTYWDVYIHTYIARLFAWPVGVFVLDFEPVFKIWNTLEQPCHKYAGLLVFSSTRSRTNDDTWIRHVLAILEVESHSPASMFLMKSI